jgi:protoheme IX farnesyltransferase
VRPKVIERLDVTQPGRMADLVELAKPSITVMVLVTTALGFFLAQDGSIEAPLLLWTLLGTGLVSAGGSALNHVVERETDAMMERTARRPLPAGRLAVEPAALYGSLLALAGLAILLFRVNGLTTALGAAAIVGYVFVYTPLKRLTSLSTVIGAFPGAVPPLMGYAAGSGGLDVGGWSLFGILFCWQLPHFLAIAWLCREDYERAGFPMLAVLDPGGRATGRQMILWAFTLIPVSLVPALVGLAGTPYLVGALALGLLFLGACIAFPFSYSNRAARNVLLASVIYLPAILVVMLVDRAL